MGGYVVGNPSFSDSLCVLCLQAAAEGREERLFGEGAVGRLCDAAEPFLVGDKFPEIYLEFPLSGDPFIDATLLYGELTPGTRIDSARAAGSEGAIDFYARERAGDELLSFGFEIDGENKGGTPAGIHFQPRGRTDLVAPFCEVEASFREGAAAGLVAQLKAWGIADGRADLIAGLSLTRGVPVVHADGTRGAYGFSLVPGWLKVRWAAGELKPAKLYLKASAGPVKGEATSPSA